MKMTFVPLIACAVMTAISLPSLADHTPEHDEMMKRCVTKQDSSMPKEGATGDEMNKSKIKKKPRMREPAATPEPDRR